MGEARGIVRARRAARRWPGVRLFTRSGLDPGLTHGMPSTTNMAFGGHDWKTLYFTTWNRLHSVNVKIPGVPVPAQRK
jgi:sugar lactone lactonase YvrE